MLPGEFLQPIRNVVRNLADYYQTTLVFCTATQPYGGDVRTKEGTFLDSLETDEIIPNPQELANLFRRVTIRFDVKEAKTWKGLSEELCCHEQVLCIVNRRDDCKALWEEMPEGTIHLSALMCAEHRSRVIADIKQRLAEGAPIRVISTQLVEAGVDMDFPVVYRARAGMDSIVQAAGRCNREGKLRDAEGNLLLGQVVVFEAPSAPPRGMLRMAAGITTQMLHEGVDDPLAVETFERYFKKLYHEQGARLDAKEIGRLSSPGKWMFRTIEERFRLIDGGYRNVIVRYGNSPALIAKLEKGERSRTLLRQAQRYTVNLPIYLHDQLLKKGSIHELQEGIYIQNEGGLYREETGFDSSFSGVYGADELMA